MNTTNKEKLKFAVYNLMKKLGYAEIEFLGFRVDVISSVLKGIDEKLTDEVAADAIKSIKRDLA